jgi:hypothetical protein
MKAFTNICHTGRVAVAMTFALAGCGGEPAAARLTVFDPSAGLGAQAVDLARSRVEVPYPTLDRAYEVETGDWIGVTILQGGVRLSRPRRWYVRDASLDPGTALLRYVSPRAYSFAVYERSDAPDDLWHDILERYEADVGRAGAKVVGKAVAVATRLNQGRAFTIERKDPRPSRSREILVRGEHRVVLVQIVTQDADSRLDAELAEVLGTMEVL